MRQRVLLLLAALGALLVGIQAPATAILNGQPDDQHPYGGIVFSEELYCSGAAISPTVVVTAAHCLELGNQFHVSFAQQPAHEADGWPSASGPGVVTGTGHLINDYCLPPGSCHPGNPGFTNQSDIAVVVLDTPVNLPRYATLPAAGLVGTLPNRQPVTDVGYGVDTRTNGTGTGRPVLLADATRRMMTGVLQQSKFSGSDKYLRLNPTDTHAQICFGDSGGPVLLGDTLIGVHSFGASPNCTGGSGAARVDLTPVLAAIRSYL